MKHFLLTLMFASVLLFCGCASSEKPKQPQPEKEDPAIVKAREEWKKFLEEHKEEDRRRHDMNTLQNDNDRVFPWRQGRRSERVYERSGSSIFSLW